MLGENDQPLASKSSSTDDGLFDDLAGDLETIVTDSTSTDALDFGQIDEAVLMPKLVMYITQRDSRVWDRAYKLGKQIKFRGK